MCALNPKIPTSYDARLQQSYFSHLMEGTGASFAAPCHKALGPPLMPSLNMQRMLTIKI